jgi:hypothetical protein
MVDQKRDKLMTTPTPDPIFIATFEGGHQTCTAVFCSPAELDVSAAMVLARWAYTRLTHRPPPPIERAVFKLGDVVLRHYCADELRHEAKSPPRSLAPFSRARFEGSNPQNLPKADRRVPPPRLFCKECGVHCRQFERATYVGAPEGGVPVHPRCVAAFFKQLVSNNSTVTACGKRTFGVSSSEATVRHAEVESERGRGMHSQLGL